MIHLIVEDPTPGIELELVPRGVCEICHEPTDDGPWCLRCELRADAAYERRMDV